MADRMAAELNRQKAEIERLRCNLNTVLLRGEIYLGVMEIPEALPLRQRRKAELADTIARVRAKETPPTEAGGASKPAQGGKELSSRGGEGAEGA